MNNVCSQTFVVLQKRLYGYAFIIPTGGLLASWMKVLNFSVGRAVFWPS
jgi:hypothetical protein